MRILINTISTKKQAGGAFQIAYNFIIKSLDYHEVEWIYVVSEDLDEMLPDALKTGSNYFVFPTQPDFGHSYKKVKKQLHELEMKHHPDLVYSVTAPSYFTFDTVEVMRFTNPWVTHPNKYSWATQSLKMRIRTRLYCWNQRRLMRKASFFVTQSETTKQGIMRITGLPSQNVKVVKNVLPQVYKTLSLGPQRIDGYWVDVACVGAPVPHKNFEIIPEVLKELKIRGVDNIRFHVTIPSTDSLWKSILSNLHIYELEDRVITHGRCTQVELAEMYRSCQLCFLPTLLEVFSASTLEAMFFHLPVVATDFDFNREVMGDSCLYYEPMNASEAALQLKKYIEDKGLQERMCNKMDERLQLFSDYDRHFNETVDFLRNVAAKHN